MHPDCQAVQEFLFVFSHSLYLGEEKKQLQSIKSQLILAKSPLEPATAILQWQAHPLLG